MRTKNLKNETIKKIAETFNIDRDTAKIIRKLAEYYYENKGTYLVDVWLNTLCGNTLNWIGQCHNHPNNREVYISMINDLIEGYGVEAVFNSQYDYSGDCFEYVNMGNTYSTTICSYDGKLFISSWGNVYEILQN